MNRFFAIVFLTILLYGCKPGIPKDIVQPPEMEKILTDIHIVDGYVASMSSPDSAKKVTAPIYKGIFKKYGIDSAMHAKSMDYYYRHPNILVKMYDNITSRLEKQKVEELKRQQKPEKNKEPKPVK
ncbi:DUF4296 domain-containing protein [Pedobacter sp. ASV28]|uniref:DUF4296 domain-containing protein n=1 Tax=Pedobacter sp. ASV28 TaxID=2795123 RepID=UPI001E62E19B|nr:DUF4296 domain-containing protein [Pedobacter sp. ASV28]